MAIVNVRQAQASDRDELVKMRAQLWPDASFEEHREEVDAVLQNKITSTLPLVILVAQLEDGTPIGFLEAGLRSHADGCNIAQPVGYVEGWFVNEAFRGHGIGAKLMRTAEDWARTQNCREMASDALIDNEPSHHAHEALGFEVVDRCVHYRKSL